MNKYIFILLLFWGCRTSLTPMISGAPSTSELLTTDDIDELLNSTLGTWKDCESGYFLKTESYVPPIVSYYFITQSSNEVKYIAYNQEYNSKNYSVVNATYSLDVFNQVDSLLSNFWTKPEIISDKGAVTDGGYIIMEGIMKDNQHKVNCSNASTNDPEIYELSKVMSQHLFLKAISKAIQAGNIR